MIVYVIYLCKKNESASKIQSGSGCNLKYGWSHFGKCNNAYIFGYNEQYVEINIILKSKRKLHIQLTRLYCINIMIKYNIIS